MQKTAQKRSILNKLREMTNVSGIAAEKFFNPEFEELMNKLRDNTDDPVRAIVTGQKIGNSEAPSDGLSLKSLLSSAKSNLNRREYMKAVADFGRFHKKMYDVVQILSNFNSNITGIHEKFLFQDLDDESKKHLHELKTRFTPVKTSSNKSYFLKKANILDFFANIGTERGRALSAWEKRYPKQVGVLKKDSASILSQSERLLNIVISVLKEMASARATRNPDKYMAAASKIIKAYEVYDKSFKTYYDVNIKGFLEKQNLIVGPKTNIVPSKNQDLTSVIEEEPKTIKNNVPATLPMRSVPETLPMENVPEVAPTSLPDPPKVPVIEMPEDDGDTERPAAIQSTKVEPATTPILKEDISTQKNKMTPEEMRQMEAMHGIAHNNFYESLRKMSGESPLVLSSFIKKYATSIQKIDPITAIQLLKISNSIKG